MFFILLFLIILGIIVWKSELQIQIQNLDISTERIEIIKKDFNICLGIIIFGKIQILKINIKKIKSRKMDLGAILDRAKRFEGMRNKKEALIGFIRSLKHFRIEIINTDLKVRLGTQDAALTAISAGTIASILGIILRKQKFEVVPIYKDKNILNIKLNCIFRINLIHYIYKTISKGRDENERKPSNRRTYAYSNE